MALDKKKPEIMLHWALEYLELSMANLIIYCTKVEPIKDDKHMSFFCELESVYKDILISLFLEAPSVKEMINGIGYRQKNNI
jgi:hypothetical protein